MSTVVELIEDTVTVPKGVVLQPAPPHMSFVRRESIMFARAPELTRERLASATAAATIGRDLDLKRHTPFRS
jgi:hypothetical protein